MDAVRLKDVAAWLFLYFTIFMTSAKLTSGEASGACSRLKMVDREEWRARPRSRDSFMTMPVNHVIIIHTVTPMCLNTFWCKRSVRGIQDYHLDEQGWPDIAYNFLIGGDGLVYMGRGWNQTNTHSINFNYNSVGIAFIGNFMTDRPTENMLNAALNLIDCGVEQGQLTPIREIHGHRDVACTRSPGDNLYEIIKKWKNFKGGRIKDYICQNN